MRKLKILGSYLALVVIFGLLAEVLGHAYYFLNKDFIIHNLSALPFTYKVALGYSQFAWWSFLISVVFGLVCASCFKPNN